MSSWLQRIAERLATEPDHAGGSHIKEHFYKRSLFGSTTAFLDALLENFPAGQDLLDRDLRVLVNELRGLWGPEKALEEGELSEHLAFWQELAARSSSAYAKACYADTLLLAGRKEDAIAVFLGVLEQDPTLLYELGDEIGEHARHIGGKDWLRFRLASLWGALGSLADADGDAIREQYSELLEEFSSDTDALHEIRKLGEALDAAVERGELPRAMVIRGPARSRN